MPRPSTPLNEVSSAPTVQRFTLDSSAPGTPWPSSSLGAVTTPEPPRKPSVPKPALPPVAPAPPPIDGPSPGPQLLIPKLVLPDKVDRSIPDGVIPQDGTGEGPKLPKFFQKDITGRNLLVMMGQVSSKGKVLKKNVTKFENHVYFDFIIEKYPIIVQGPNGLKCVRIDGRCGPELFKAVVSDFIWTYEGWLPLQNIDNCKCTRHMWISSILIQQASAIRCMAVGTQREGSGRIKRHRKERASEGSVKRPKRDCTVRIWGSVASQAFRLYSGLRKFGDLIKWIASRAKPTGQRITLHAQYTCTLEGVQAEDVGVMAGQEFDGEIFDQDTWDSEVENFFLVAPKAAVLFIEVRLVKEPEEEAGGALESVVDLDAVDLEMAGKAAADTVSFSSTLGVGCIRANRQMVLIAEGRRQGKEGWGGELRCRF